MWQLREPLGQRLEVEFSFPDLPMFLRELFPDIKRLLQVVSVPVGALPERFVDCEIEQHPVERRVVPDNLRYMSSQFWIARDSSKSLQIGCMRRDVSPREERI